MRDNLRTAEYWEERIYEGISGISRLTDHMLLKSYYFTLLNLYYSAGKPVEEIAEIFPPLLDTMEKVWGTGSSYLDMLWTLSFGIMIDAPLDSIRKLEALVVRDKRYDRLYDFLFRSVDPQWEMRAERFLMKQPYSTLEPLIEGQTEDHAAFLKEYLEKRWYKPHRQMAWYGSHKKDDLYDGYWSFESGAIAKILKIDDSGLKDTSYYPYDLAHYTDSGS